jgi:hypothetical protein
MHGVIPPLPQYAFIAWCLVNHRDNFTFTFCMIVLLASIMLVTVFRVILCILLFMYKGKVCKSTLHFQSVMLSCDIKS